VAGSRACRSAAKTPFPSGTRNSAVGRGASRRQTHAPPSRPAIDDDRVARASRRSSRRVGCRPPHLPVPGSPAAGRRRRGRQSIAAWPLQTVLCQLLVGLSRSPHLLVGAGRVLHLTDRQPPCGMCRPLLQVPACGRVGRRSDRSRRHPAVAPCRVRRTVRRCAPGSAPCCAARLWSAPSLFDICRRKLCIAGFGNRSTVGRSVIRVRHQVGVELAVQSTARSAPVLTIKTSRPGAAIDKVVVGRIGVGALLSVPLVVRSSSALLRSSPQPARVWSRTPLPNPTIQVSCRGSP